MMFRNLGHTRGGGVSECRRRRGSLLAEAVMSSVMLMAAMSLTVKVMGWVALERRESEHRELALEEVANLMERIVGRPYEGVTAEALKSTSLSEESRSRLPGADLRVEIAVDDPVGGKDSKKVALHLRWRDRSGGWAAPVRLATWIYGRRSGR